MSSTKRNPGALAGATGAEIKAPKLLAKDSTDTTARKAFPRQAAWRDRNPLKTWAHASLRSGIRRGLIQPQPCEECGAEKTEGHHDDYARPLEVRWLCRRHHKALHARRAKR